MNWTQIEGKWDQVKGDVKTKWGKLTDDDMTSLKGKKDGLVGKIVERYGVLKDEAETQVDEWLHKLDIKTDEIKQRSRREEDERRKTSTREDVQARA